MIGIRQAASFRRGYGIAVPALLACTFLSLVIAPPASAARLVGSVFTPTGLCGANATFIQSESPVVVGATEYAAPGSGVITGWIFRADANPPDLKFKVARSLGGGNFLIVGQSEVQDPAANVDNFYPTQISVEGGDVIGFHLTTPGNCLQHSVPGYTRIVTSSDPPPGSVMTGPPGNSKLAIAAIWEPDDDRDGFGDESQDQCVGLFGSESGCPPPTPDTTPPETKLTANPSEKTSKRTTVFDFVSDPPEDGVSFECRVDGGAFASCVPKRPPAPPPFGIELTVDRGKHEFEVRAIDAAGNIDPTPASFKWRVLSRSCLAAHNQLEAAKKKLEEADSPEEIEKAESLVRQFKRLVREKCPKGSPGKGSPGKGLRVLPERDLGPT